MKNKYTAHISQFIKIILYTLAGIIISACEKISPVDQASLQPDMLVKNFTSSSYQNGNLSWKIIAGESSYFFSENRSIIKNIILDYFKNNKFSARVTAETAIISLDSNDIDLIGNVSMNSISGNRLFTPEIMWSNRNKMLETDEQVRIIKKNGDIIEGTGLRADYNLEYYEIKRSVVAVAKSPGKKNEKKN